ncbi:Methyltransferase type 11 [Parafrankia sp. EAN1pec]|uniref:methyltransferase domain-containing protein n=1 Tax=Parafrankia sp. (strain EAN1pec) TaxID=298653 RepID=UPI0000541896|nr:Methyltransferase type 11 [Frankia sp. EAN1pec]
MTDHGEGGQNAYVLTLDPSELARYQFMAAVAKQDESAEWTAAGIVPGARVADVGCGPAALALALAAVVGPTGKVDAVDRDPDARALAGQVVAAGKADNISITEGSADASGLPAASYDTVMMRHVLAHNGGREQAIVDHLATLVKPGGWVYLLDIDASALRVVGGPPTVTDIVELGERYHRFHATLGNDLSVGLRLGALLRSAGLVDVHHRGWYNVNELPPGMRPPSWAAVPAMTAAGHADSDDVERWERAFAELDAATDRPTYFVPVFSARARRPVGG